MASHGTENRWASEADGSPFHLPKIIPTKEARWTTKEYKQEFTGKVPLSEKIIPNRKTKAIDKNTETIGEKPPQPFSLMKRYRQETPQISTMVRYMTDLIVGTDININTDDDEATQFLTEFAERINLHQKIRSLVDTSLEGGTAIFVRALTNGYLTNIEEFDMDMVKRIHRDLFGNPKFLVVDGGNGIEEKINDINHFIPITLRKSGRDYFGLSMFHGLSVFRHTGNRTTRPIIEALWSLDDTSIGFLENYAYPIEYHVFDGINDEDLEKEAIKYKERAPGDAFFVNRGHEIQTREAQRVEVQSVFQHFKDQIQLGSGFPLEILLGDFTSRAASQTTDSLLMREVNANQKDLTKTIQAEILEFYLRLSPESRWKTDEAIKKLNVNCEFETNSAIDMTPENVLSWANAGKITVNEAREWLKDKGFDLFEDDIIQQQQEINDQMRQNELQNSSIMQKDQPKSSVEKPAGGPRKTPAKEK